MPRSRHRLAAPIVLLALLGPGTRARAEGLTLRLEPTYRAGTTIATDETGVRSTTRSQALDQRYRLTLDRNLSTALRLDAAGLLQWQRGWNALPTGNAEQDARLWNANAGLTFRGTALGGGARYDRREESLESRALGLVTTTPGRVNEQYSLHADWRPDNAPRVTLRVGHGLTYDRSRSLADLTVDDATLNASFTPTPGLDLRYGGQYSRPADHLNRIVTTQLRQTGRAAYTRPFLGDRGLFSVGYTLLHRTSETVASGAGGTVAEQQFPTQGFSIVEPLPAPEQTRLNPNPALIDGALDVSAGVDVGYGRTLAGDNRFRDFGAELADPTTLVNRIDVYVDRTLAPEIAAAFTWTAYRSDDNQSWTAVPLGGGVVFEPFANRFEIPIASVQVRYLKVVTRPLLPSVTTDQRFESVFVTEIQLLAVSSAQATDARGRQSALSGIFGGAASVRILRSPDLLYDNSLSLSHASQPSFRYTWSTVNGLSLSHPLSRTVGLRMRADRSDSEGPTGHSAQNRLSGTLVVDPIPAVTAAATATGQITQSPLGMGSQSALSLMSRLEPYRGVSLGANGTASLGKSEVGQATRALLAGATLSLVPHPKATIAGSYAYSQTRAFGGGLASSSSKLQVIEANVSLQPFPALFGSVGATRTIAGGPAATLASFVVGFSPFRDGDLLLRASYTDTIDTLSRQRTRSAGPSLRWNVRRGTYLDVAYSHQQTDSPVSDTLTRGFFANLVVTPIG